MLELSLVLLNSPLSIATSPISSLSTTSLAPKDCRMTKLEQTVIAAELEREDSGGMEPSTKIEIEVGRLPDSRLDGKCGRSPWKGMNVNIDGTRKSI